MNRNKLKTGNEIIELIDTTKQAIKELDLYIKDSEEWSKHDESYTYKQDDNYNLYISRYYKDTVNRINYRINLSRHFGNTAILKLIKDELESQLESFKKDFDEL